MALQARRDGVFLYATILQIIYPLFDRCCGHIIEIVYADDEILGKHILGHSHLYLILLAGVHFQQVAGMYSLKHRLAVIEIVVP